MATHAVGPQIAQHRQPLASASANVARSSRDREPTNVPEVVQNIREDVNGNLVVRNYVREKLLGVGGFAKCYRFKLEEKNRIVAGKVVDKESLAKAKAKQKLLAEIKIHRSLNHPYIVGFETFFEDKTNVYIMLEICSNQTLLELVKRRKQLTEPEAAYFCLQLLDAMRYLHHHNIIHRDLKLGNLFLTEDMKIRVGDFGLAAQLADKNERKKTVCGTPNYIAPEILERQNGHSFEVDTWAFGVIMYTLLIGKPPFETDKVETTYRRIRENIYSFPAEIPVSNEAKDLITKILMPNPADRPSLDNIAKHPFFTRAGMMIPTYLSQRALTGPVRFAPEYLVAGSVLVEDMLSQPIGELNVKRSGSSTAAHTSAPSSRMDQENVHPSAPQHHTGLPRTMSGPAMSTLQPYNDNMTNNLNGHSVPRPFPAARATSLSENVYPRDAKELYTSSTVSNRHRMPFGTQMSVSSNTQTENTMTFSVSTPNPADMAGLHIDVPSNSGADGTNSYSGNTPSDTPSSTTNTNLWLQNMQQSVVSLTASSRPSSSQTSRIPFTPVYNASVNSASAVSNNQMKPMKGLSENYNHNSMNNANSGSCSAAPSTNTASLGINRVRSIPGFSVTSEPLSAASGIRSVAPTPASSSAATNTQNEHITQRPSSLDAGNFSTPAMSSLNTNLNTLSINNQLTSPSKSSNAHGFRSATTHSTAVNNNHMNPNQETLSNIFESMGNDHDNATSPNILQHSPMANFPGLLHNSTRFSAGPSASLSVLPNKVWVTQWLDYTCKYGMGYQLSNGWVGVHFNDSTKILVSPDDVHFEYIERHSDQTPELLPNTRIVTGVDGHIRLVGELANYPESLKKKVTLLRFFMTHFRNQYQRRMQLACGEITHEEAITAGAASGTYGSTTSIQSESQTPGNMNSLANCLPIPVSAEEEVCMNGEGGTYAAGSVPFMKKSIRTRKALLMRLSNHSVQVFFHDGANIILTAGNVQCNGVTGNLAQYIDRHGSHLVMHMPTALALGAAATANGYNSSRYLDLEARQFTSYDAALRRLSYVKRLLEQLLYPSDKAMQSPTMN